MTHIFLKPKPGVIVRMPNLKPLPENGASVPWTGNDGKFWRRRISDGSVIVSEPAKQEIKVEQKSEIRRNKNDII